jgi:multiple sugar transport system substrate-binding protein
MAAPLEVCNFETHACQCQCTDCAGQELEPDLESVTSLNIFTWQLNCLRFQNHAKDFQAKTSIRVNIECITEPLTRDKFHDEILSDAKTQTGLYDGYTLGPHLFGDLDLLNGLYDLTPLVRSGIIGSMAGYSFNWNDIFLFARENGAVYDKKIVGIPIDGDVHTLYYRTDLFAKYNKKPPATWEEYTALAKFFHGKEELIPGTNQTVPISGSCVGKLERTEFWVFLILSSMTQYEGTHTGFLFDTRNGRNMEPLLGEAFVQTLKFMEEQFVYGADNEYEGSFADVNLDRMNSGRCAMTYNWGDAFTEAAKAPPASLISGYLGSAHTPGSPYYLDRDTQMLQHCTEDICTCGNEFYPGHNNEDSACINSAPYAAFTGWSASCSNFVSPAQQRACVEFFGYVSSPENSVADTIPNVTVGAPVITVDPYRMSQTVLSDWVERGLPEQSSQEYLDTIKTQLSSPNVVLDMRFPAAAAFQSEMNAVFRDHLTVLKKKRDAGMQGEDILSTVAERWQVEQDVRSRWKKIIATYDRTHSFPLLEAYQKNLGIYVPPEASTTPLGVGPIVGIALVIFGVLLVAIAYVRWEKRKKNDRMWKIKKEDLKFDDPPKIVGRGRFGVVSLAEYRGTEVAVKSIIPRNKRTVRVGSLECSEDPEGTLINSSGSTQDEESGDCGAFLDGKATMMKSTSRSTSRSIERKQLKKHFVEEMRLLSTLRHPW